MTWYRALKIAILPGIIVGILAVAINQYLSRPKNIWIPFVKEKRIGDESIWMRRW